MDKLPDDVLRVWLLPCLTTRDACEMRLVNKAHKATVTAHPWADVETVIKGSLADWRVCFPHACAANLNQSDVYKAPTPAGLRAAPIPQEHFCHLTGLSFLSVRGNASFTDEALLHLGGSVQHLDVSGCMALSGQNMENVSGATLVEMHFCHRAAYNNALRRGVRAVWTGAEGLCSGCGRKHAQSIARGTDAKQYCSTACYPPGVRRMM